MKVFIKRPSNKATRGVLDLVVLTSYSFWIALYKFKLIFTKEQINYVTLKSNKQPAVSVMTI
jgi:hypothetical protein